MKTFITRKKSTKKRRNEGILLCGRKNHRANERLHNRHRVTTINIATGQKDIEIHREKLTNRYQDVVKNEVNFGGEVPVNIEYENNKQKMEVFITERNDAPGHGLDKNISTNNRNNSYGREQPIIERKNTHETSESIRK